MVFVADVSVWVQLEEGVSEGVGSGGAVGDYSKPVDV